jgi:hypothetical protein
MRWGSYAGFDGLGPELHIDMDIWHDFDRKDDEAVVADRRGIVPEARRLDPARNVRAQDAL